MHKNLIFWTLRFVTKITKLLLVGIESHHSSNTLNFTSFWNFFGLKTHKINTVKVMIKILKVIFLRRTDFKERYKRTENELYQK